RTILNLYNLHAVRGLLADDASLIFPSSMSGPHHYFGWINPRKHHTIDFTQGGPVYIQAKTSPSEKEERRSLRRVTDDMILRITDYEWLKGTELDPEARRAYAVRDELAVHLVNEETGEADSLFDNPGILKLDTHELHFPLMQDAYRYNLAPFGAQV